MVELMSLCRCKEATLRLYVWLDEGAMAVLTVLWCPCFYKGLSLFVRELCCPK